MEDLIEVQRLRLVSALKQACIESLKLSILSSRANNLEDYLGYKKIGTKLDDIAEAILSR